MKTAFGNALAAAALAACCAARQSAPAMPANMADPVITVEFRNPNLSPSQWTLTLHPDGSGHFRSTMGPANADSAGQMRAPDLNRDIQLSPRFAAAAFLTAARHFWFAENCESHLKVAFQGWKTLAYSGPQGDGSCTFNYSRDKDIQALGDSFMGVSDTILEGERLEMLLQHDPLGLETEIESLSQAVEDGRARQICVIKDILQRLANDDNVMQIVRKHARLLLARSQTG